MKREIYEVYAKVVDANGSYNTLSGYPKVYDSHQNSDDCETAQRKAYAEYYSLIGTMYNRTDRQCQIAMIISANTGNQIARTCIGKIADLPDPTYTVIVANGIGSGNYSQGVLVGITANPPVEGKRFASWEGAENLTFTSGSMYASTAIFLMPNKNVTLTATYEDIP